MGDWRVFSAYVMVITFTKDGGYLEEMRMGENRIRLEMYGSTWADNFMRQYPEGRVEIQIYDMDTGLQVSYESRSPV